jgi:peroxiredoxin
LKRWGLIALLVAGLAWIYLTRAQDPALLVPPGQRPPSPQAGFPAPEFALVGMDGQTVRLADLKGQPVVLNFWATWCPPCQAEMPALQALTDAYAGRGVTVLGVNQAEGADQVRGFLQSKGIDFPVVLDADAGVSQAYRVRSLPTTFFIDREGVIDEIVIGGPLSRALLESKVQTLVER